MPPQKKNSNFSRGLDLEWCVGLNYKIPNSVYNLTTEDHKKILYASGHIAIVYDYENKTQMLLQGHSNEITALNYNKSKNLIVTADKGESCMMIVWNEKTGIPQRTFFLQDQPGIKALDICKNGELILTLSFEFNGQQRIQVWNWSDYSKENPIVNDELTNLSEGLYNFIRWNYCDYQEFVTTGKKVVSFWKRQNDKCTFYSPYINKKNDLQKDNYKEFSQTIFIPENQGAQAITGTMDGNLIVWDTILILEELSNMNRRREIKTINLLNNQSKKYGDQILGISLLDIYNDTIVIGTTVGTVRFYDLRFRIICWFEDLNLKTINSLSFSSCLPVHLNQQKILEDMGEQEILYPEFIVCDYGASVTILSTNLFSEIVPSKRKGQLVLQGIKSQVVYMSVNNKSNKLALTCSEGQVLEWKLWNNCLLELKNFQDENSFDEYGTCLQYSPDGLYLIVGTSQGNLYIKKKNNDLNKKKQFNLAPLLISHKKKGIVCEKLIFSKCSKFLAVTDDHKCVSLFVLGHKYGDKKQPIEWVFKSKIRAHTLKITDICFGQYYNPGETQPSLYSISEDMHLVEYKISNNEKDPEKQIQVQKMIKIESNDIPTAIMIYPQQYYQKENLLISNTEYKFKIWENSESEIFTRMTCLGPSFAGPVQNLEYLQPPQNFNSKNQYITFSSSEKVLGITRLPLTGNPNNSIGVISNPNKINSHCVSPNGKYIFTSGSSDLSLNVWNVNFFDLEQNQLLNINSDNPLELYSELLEGGEEGELYRDLKDFFYYSQIRKKQENTTKAHKLDGKIPLKEIPNLMIALGHYPSQQEIENMKNEVRFSGNKENEFVNNLSLKDFVKLFVNHRSPYGLTKEYVQEELAPLYGNNKTINKQQFLDLLRNNGEEFSDDEINKYLNILLGKGQTKDLLPDEIDLNFIIEKLLGFEYQQLILYFIIEKSYFVLQTFQFIN